MKKLLLINKSLKNVLKSDDQPTELVSQMTMEFYGIIKDTKVVEE
jgi:hypothetical protein